VLVFIDGIGLGDPSPINPFTVIETGYLPSLLGGRPLTREAIGYSDERVTLLGLDALLGVPGLPQSATGQASIFTGENAPRLIGCHLNGFPNKTLRKLLAAKGIFSRFIQEGYRCAFINAYRPPFFHLLKLGLPGRRYSCSTLVTYYAGLPFRNLEDLREGRALYMDINNALLSRMGFDVPEISPEAAGKRLAELSGDYDFTMFEYFLSDLAGHLGSMEEAGKVIGILDRFLGSAAAGLDPAESLLIVTSDHGNMEDLSHREHTGNSVPALLIGPAPVRRQIAPLLSDLTHILPAVRTVLLWDG
jgi:hypothetical protein